MTSLGSLQATFAVTYAGTAPAEATPPPSAEQVDCSDTSSLKSSDPTRFASLCSGQSQSVPPSETQPQLTFYNLADYYNANASFKAAITTPNNWSYTTLDRNINPIREATADTVNGVFKRVWDTLPQKEVISTLLTDFTIDTSAWLDTPETHDQVVAFLKDPKSIKSLTLIEVATDCRVVRLYRVTPQTGEPFVLAHIQILKSLEDTPMRSFTIAEADAAYLNKAALINKLVQGDTVDFKSEIISENVSQITTYGSEQSTARIVDNVKTDWDPIKELMPPPEAVAPAIPVASLPVAASATSDVASTDSIKTQVGPSAQAKKQKKSHERPSREPWRLSKPQVEGEAAITVKGGLYKPTGQSNRTNPDYTAYDAKAAFTLGSYFSLLRVGNEKIGLQFLSPEVVGNFGGGSFWSAGSEDASKLGVGFAELSLRDYPMTVDGNWGHIGLGASFTVTGGVDIGHVFVADEEVNVSPENGGLNRSFGYGPILSVYGQKVYLNLAYEMTPNRTVRGDMALYPGQPNGLDLGTKDDPSQVVTLSLGSHF